jgi:hypothetical protein
MLQPEANSAQTWHELVMKVKLGLRGIEIILYSINLDFSVRKQ